MSAVDRSTVVGVFTNRVLAEQAIEELARAGFTDEQMGFVARDGEELQASIASDQRKSEVLGATTGAVGGGIAGGVMTAAAALLIPGFGPAVAGGVLTATLGGAAIGALTGGLAAAFVSMGMSEEEARYYQRELSEGRIVIVVKANGRNQEAFGIMSRNSAYDASTRPEGTPSLSSGTAEPNTDVHSDEYNPNIPPGAQG